MDAFGTVKKRNERGFALVYIALMIVVLVGFVSLAVDMGYMYVAKGQLQNAADAAALAGAAMNLSVPTDVKAKAKEFAAANKAAGDPVVITDDDVTVGNWEAKTSTFTAPPLPSGKVVNAVKVVARRTEAGATAAEQGRVHTFFGNIFSLLPGGGEGWAEMSAAAQAIASRPPRPTIPIALCQTVCSKTIPPAVKFFFKENDPTKIDSGKGKDPPPPPPAELTLGWTEFSFTSQATDLGPKSDIAKYIHGELHPPDVCNKEIYTNNGIGEAVNELIDEFDARKNDSGYWEVIVPIVSDGVGKDGKTVSACPPGDQPIPYPLANFAIAWITSVVKGSSPGVTFSKIECLPCGDPRLVGGIPTLVK
ncbi:TadE/TadG family type IV pilus assembly protein [Geomonas anaerohicana]|uniref:Tad domain-containing protein n=1 Tax=Geomonas anaerohicana TaxID=2798583 RepID=A0ABS0YFE8_9BACT|nr:Tad domain-containing protein [Geomonas anaerohicana]MBJ6751044.1 Tad domain-containing protein [Geomonas anaerohicana]